MKCIWKMTKVLPQMIKDEKILPSALLLDIHNFLIVCPPDHWKKKLTESGDVQSDMPLKTVKTIIHEVAKCLGQEVFTCLNEIPEIENSFCVSYLRAIVGNVKIPEKPILQTKYKDI